ncbi:hypothetical protein KXR53_21090 [Inquilinus limosus]|uniref:hypothetical protein n=1 Tax=Inquilinus limosus TaxID=171674 RepID=UPI003F1574E6
MNQTDDAPTQLHEEEYSNHKSQLEESRPPESRLAELEAALLSAFKGFIELREIPVIMFGDLSVDELTTAFHRYPIIIKPILTSVNVAQRALKRDLDLAFDTYSLSVPERVAAQIAGYVKPFLPKSLAVPALLELDRYAWTDKQMRQRKGAWEQTVTEIINTDSNRRFRKRKFNCNGEIFEIDAAYPASGGPIKVAIDVKRIESQRDIHKRADEIINKANKFKQTHPEGRFFAIVYYPFPQQHANAGNRLQHPDIDQIYFAGETRSSIKHAVDLLMGYLGFGVQDTEE